MITITVVNNIYCQVDSTTKNILQDALSFDAVYYKKREFSKERVEYRKHAFWKIDNSWLFFRGLMDRAIAELKERDFPFRIKWEQEDFCPRSVVPKVKGIEDRDYQFDLIRKIRRYKRGVIKSATGSGKTIMQAMVTSAYPDSKILLLAHTIDIVQQTVIKFKEYGIVVYQMRGKPSVTQSGFNFQVVVATVQTLQAAIKRGRKEPEFMAMLSKNLSNIEVVMVDECHHLSKLEGSYADVLTHTNAPIRIGFTATEPTDGEKIFALEGLMGPLIGDLNIQTATDLGIIVKPKVKLIKIPFNSRVKDERRYQDVYDRGIVENVTRNRIIINLVKDTVDQTFLILVNKIQHGYNLEQIGQSHMGEKCQFIHGETLAEDRLVVKDLLERKKITCAIVTTIWKEGIDIPSLNGIINAAGGKSEIATLQFIGRGLRKVEGKEFVTVYDFFDSSHYYLISHFGERITLYMDNGWL